MTDAEERSSTTPRPRMTSKDRKRASGESSIYRDDDGRWHGFVSMGQKENGRRDRRHVSGAKRADVVAKVRAIEAKRDAGMVDAAGRAPTVGEWLDHWLDNIASRKVRARTLESYRSTVRLHLRPGIGHHRLDRLQPEHLEQLYAALAEKGLSPASILRAHRVLSRAVRVASQRGKVARNVATLVDPPAVKRPQRALPLSAAEAREVMSAAHSHRNAARWTVALAVGLRQSEALGLRWSDVDLDNGTQASDGVCTGSAGKASSTRSRKPTAAAGPWRCPHNSSMHCGRTGPRSSRSESPPARCGKTTTWSSPSPTAGRSSASRTGAPGRHSCATQECARSGCTTGGTPRRRCCCPRACIRGSSWRCSATHRCERRRTPTATSCPRSAAMPPSAWGTRCGSDPAPHSLQWPPRWHQKRPRPLS
jgi:hypothetical protein